MRRRTLAVSRANSRSEARAKAVGVGSTAGFRQLMLPIAPVAHTATRRSHPRSPASFRQTYPPALDVLHPRQCLRELRQRRTPHHGRSRGEHDRDTEDARGAGERDDIVAHLVRREIANARNEPGLVVDKQEDGALRREALVGAAPAALGLVYRLRIAHSVLLL